MIETYFHCGKYPAGSRVNQKRATQNKAKKVVITDGVLHYKTKDGFRDTSAAENNPGLKT